MAEKDTLHLVVAPAAEVKRDVRRNLPWLAVLLIVTFVYVLVMSVVIRMFENQWTFLHGFYFTVINMTTVGFGDIVPLSHGGKIIAGVNAFVGPLLFGILVAVFALALQPVGWSAKLTSIEEKNGREQSRQHEDEPIENGVAELFESLATLVRATDLKEMNVPQEGEVRIHMQRDGSTRLTIHVLVHVDAG